MEITWGREKKTSIIRVNLDEDDLMWIFGLKVSVKETSKGPQKQVFK